MFTAGILQWLRSGQRWPEISEFRSCRGLEDATKGDVWHMTTDTVTLETGVSYKEEEGIEVCRSPSHHLHVESDWNIKACVIAKAMVC